MVGMLWSSNDDDYVNRLGQPARRVIRVDRGTPQRPASQGGTEQSRKIDAAPPQVKQPLPQKRPLPRMREVHLTPIARPGQRRRPGRRPAALAVALLTLTAPLAAQPTPPRSDSLVRPAPLAARHLVVPPVIDGRLDDPAWQDATPIATNFTQFSPTPGAPASQRSEVRVRYDDRAVYVAARLYDTHPDSIATQLGRRDSDEIYSDWFSVTLDSYADRRTAFEFSVSARGVLRDTYRFDDSEEDILWDAVWNVATRIDSLGWTAEFRIPLSQLRYDVNPGGGAARGRWGINFTREIARLGELNVWAPTSPNAPGIVSRFGDLVGLDSLRGASRYELIPYVRGQSTLTPSTQQSVFVPGTAWGGAVGGDLRLKLPQSLTLTASINPDFGQVEADPAVVNLTAFEIFFPERRPFFLENADVFSFGATRTFNDNDRPNFFYTRRIGRRPQVAPRGTDIAENDLPRTTPILGAIKLSGTTPGGWQIGSLNALTSREFARVATTTGSRRSVTAEPLSNYHVTRVRRLLRGGNTGIGGFVASTIRETGDSSLMAQLTDRATIGGLDFETAWRQRRYTISGVIAGSEVRGSSSAITRLQRANYRAFQRPDATHLAFDPSRTALGGHYGSLSLAKTAGQHFVGSVTYEETSPGFESNDIGFQFRSDFRSVSTGLFWRDFAINRRTREWEAGLFATVSDNFEGESIEQRTTWFGRALLPNFWEVETMGNITPPTMNDRLLRGGPLALRPQGWRQSLELTSDTRKRIIVGGGAAVSGDASGARTRGVGLNLDWRPIPAVRMQLNPTYEASTRTDQFVARIDDASATRTFGGRYVFSDVRQREARLDTRLDWTFSPWLTFQLFLQPFVSAGQFLTFKEFTSPRRFAFRVYGEEGSTIVRPGSGPYRIDPDGAGPARAFTLSPQDFTVRALRGNAVLRWEYTPGSTLFLVWTQQRETAFDDARLNVQGQFGPLFNDPGQHVLLIKFSRWIGR